MNYLAPKLELESIISYAKRYYDKGWLPATAGNLSFRETEDIIWITSSGLDKGSLVVTDFIPFSLKENRTLETNPNRKPSAETSIHRAIYLSHPETRFIFHIHNLSSMRIQMQLTRENPMAQFALPPFELIKVFGIWEENPQVYIPVFYNHGDVSQIARDVETYFQNYNQNLNSESSQFPTKYEIPVLMVENHGPTFWGKDVISVNRFIEAVDYILNAISFLK